MRVLNAFSASIVSACPAAIESSAYVHLLYCYSFRSSPALVSFVSNSMLRVAFGLHATGFAVSRAHWRMCVCVCGAADDVRVFAFFKRFGW